MKKLLSALLVSLAAMTATAQKSNHAIGFHIGGSTADLEYRYYLDKRSFIDATAGVFAYTDAFLAQVTYNHDIAKWEDWTPEFATWNLWGGIGGAVGAHSDGALFGPTVTLGFGFKTRKVPFTVGIDYRPALLFNAGDSFDVLTRGFANVGFTLTYRF